MRTDAGEVDADIDNDADNDDNRERRIRRRIRNSTACTGGTLFLPTGFLCTGGHQGSERPEAIF